MPIISIIEQPAINDLKAAYRPVVFKVNATRTDGNAVPTVVFCDIYVDGTFYKSAHKTHYSFLNSTNSTWEFDIMDACQEVLKAFLAANGGSTIVAASTVMAQIYCKFRSSGINTDGFLVSEGTAPVQGTGTTDPVAGTGTQSNTFFVANSVLQHEQNQSLSAHLNYYKNGTWGANVFPLSHRPNGYKICNSDSDFFPVVNLSAEDLECFVIHFKSKGDSSFSSETYCPGAPCTPVNVPSVTFPRATKNVPYSKTVTVTGTAPFSFSNIVAPGWMNVNISGGSITFNGTPNDADVGTGQVVSFTAANDCGSVPVSTTVDVTASTCVPVVISGTPSLPDGLLNTPYSYSFGITGDAPFTVSVSQKPGWMLIQPVGSSIVFSGTPDAGGDNIPVSFAINNCSGSSVGFNGSVNIITTVEVSGTITNSVHSVFVSINKAISCDVTFQIKSGNDDGASIVEIDTPVKVLATQTSGTFYKGDSLPISCVKPSEMSASTFTQTYVCGGITYNFTLNIPNTCP